MSSNQFDILENEVGEYDQQDDRTTDEDVDMDDVSDRDSETPPAKRDEDQDDDDDGEWRPAKGKKANKARTATEADLEEKPAFKAKTQRFAYDAYADFAARKNAAKKHGIVSDDEDDNEPDDDSDDDTAGNKGGASFMGDARRQTFNGAKASGDAQAKAFFAQTGMPLPPDTTGAPPRASNTGASAGPSSRAGGGAGPSTAGAAKQGNASGGAPPPPPPTGQPAGAANAPPNPGATAPTPPPARTVGTPAPYPYQPKVGRRAAHEQQPRDAFGFSIWPREVQLSGIPSARALSSNLEPIQRKAFTEADPNTCVFLYYECAEHTDMPAAVARFALENYGKGRFPGGPPLQIITANPNPRLGKNFRSKTAFARGTREQIKDIIDELVISTTLGCFIAVPINAGPPTLLCTWANLTFRADQAGEVLVLVIAASRACKELRDALALQSNDLIPAGANPTDWFADSLHVVPFEINEPGTQITATWWHIHALVPTSDSEAHSKFRKVFAKNVNIVTAYDGYSSTPEKPFKCSICRSIEHPQGLCPLPKQPEWYGFVPRDRGVVEPEPADDEDEPKLAEAEEPTPKEPGPSQLPKPTMSKNFGDKGGKGKGKGKSNGKK